MEKKLTRRRMLVGLPACGVGFALARPSWGGAAFPISLRELVGASHHALVGIPREATAQWEKMGDQRRIMTYTRVEVLQPVDGRAPVDSSVFVRTLGGRVGDIGQIVHGEADLHRNQPAVLFLQQVDSGVFAVAALAQGHYPLRKDESKTPRLQASPRLSDFITKDPFCAVARLRGRTVAAAEELVLEELHRQ